jgi:hypothetical protein
MITNWQPRRWTAYLTTELLDFLITEDGDYLITDDSYNNIWIPRPII